MAIDPNARYEAAMKTGFAAASSFAVLTITGSVLALPPGPRSHVVEPSDGLKTSFNAVQANAARAAGEAAQSHAQSAKPVVDKNMAAIRAAAAKAHFNLDALIAAIHAAYAENDAAKRAADVAHVKGEIAQLVQILERAGIRRDVILKEVAEATGAPPGSFSGGDSGGIVSREGDGNNGGSLEPVAGSVKLDLAAPFNFLHASGPRVNVSADGWVRSSTGGGGSGYLSDSGTVGNALQPPKSGKMHASAAVHVDYKTGGGAALGVAYAGGDVEIHVVANGHDVCKQTIHVIRENATVFGGWSEAGSEELTLACDANVSSTQQYAVVVMGLNTSGGVGGGGAFLDLHVKLKDLRVSIP